VVDTINPSTRVGVGNLMEVIEQATMAKYEDVDELLKHLQATYNRILDEGESYPHFLRYLFKELLTAKNRVFANTIQSLKDNWEIGKDITINVVIGAASAKHKNVKVDKS